MDRSSQEAITRISRHSVRRVVEPSSVAKAAACDIARLRLYDDTAPERVMGRASSARKRIRQLAAGELYLLTFQGARVERRPSILVDAAEPIATRARLAGYLGDAP